MRNNEPELGQVPSELRALEKSFVTAVFSADGRLLRSNERFGDLFGHLTAPRKEATGRDSLPQEQRSGDTRQGGEGLFAGPTQYDEIRCTTSDDHPVWINAALTPMIRGDGTVAEVVLIASDITEDKLRQTDLEGQIQAISRSQCLLTMAIDGTILDANEQMLSLLEYSREEVRGKNHRMLLSRSDANSEEYAKFWLKLRKGAFHSGMYRRYGKDGKEIWLQATYNPIFDLNGRPTKISKVATDVTSNIALSRAYEDAMRQSQHDTATALPNRARLSTFMNTALSVENARLTILYIDVDRFKSINDTLGHHVGDLVLGQVADRLRRALKSDQLVARIGGDEFVIAAPGLPANRIEPFCRRLLDLARKPIRHENREIEVSLSIGVATSPGDGTSPDELLQAADAALYRAKQDGRDCYRFHASELNERIRADGTLAQDMHRGMKAGQFFLEYQPRFDTGKGTIRCLEALIRWNHPVHGLINPGDFIALAERSGLIVPLGNWILKTACQQAAAWPGVSVSVNVSPIQFKEEALPGMVQDALSQAGLPAERLEIEITEGVLLEDAERARRVLKELKALGIRLAMDDFGTGYSSLSYLQKFPFDVIKIDQRFIADLETDENGRAIVQAILGLGKALGMAVTAEGVETEEQLAILMRDRCHEVQGFLFSRPLAAEKVNELLDRCSALAASETPALKVVNG